MGLKFDTSHLSEKAKITYRARREVLSYTTEQQVDLLYAQQRERRKALQRAALLESGKNPNDFDNL